MGADAGANPQWRHLLPIPGLDQERADASRPIRVVVDVDPSRLDQPGLQHLTWLLVSLLTRSTSDVIAAVGLNTRDARLIPGIDPGAPNGGPSLLDALKATVDAFGPQAAPVVDARKLDGVDLVLQIGSTATTAWPEAAVLHVSAAGWTGAVTPHAHGSLPLDVASENPFGPYVAACLAAGQAYMHARIRDHQLPTVAINAWTLTQATANPAAAAAADPGAPAVHLDHVLAGVGAVGSALLLTLWAYRPASGTIRAADADPHGVDDTNLNRCLPFRWADLGCPKAQTAAGRLSGHHGVTIEPSHGFAESLVGPGTHLISAVDTAKARQALQDKYPASAVQASTSGLRLELLRVDPTHGTACLRCFNQPREQTPDSEVRAQVAEMDDAAVAVHATAVGTDTEQVRQWGRTGGCGRVGDALLERLRPSDGSAAQFSVGFMSVLAGTLLAAQVIKDAIRRDGDLLGVVDSVPLHGSTARLVINCLDPTHVAAGVRRYGRDSTCPACRGVRADIWTQRYTG
jgi:molybdopterin/thiamine biosynthesis adenylyltransferase